MSLLRRPMLGRLLALATALLLVAPTLTFAHDPDFATRRLHQAHSRATPPSTGATSRSSSTRRPRRSSSSSTSATPHNRLAGDVRLRPDQAASFRVAGGPDRQAQPPSRRAVRADDLQRCVDRDRPGPDPPAEPRLGQPDRDERPHRRARDPARAPGTGSSRRPRAASGRSAPTGWEPKTDNLPSLSMGALAVRPEQRQHRLRRHRRGRPVRRQLLRQRRPQVDRRRADLEPRLRQLLRSASRSRGCSSTRTTRTTCSCPSSAAAAARAASPRRSIRSSASGSRRTAAPAGS